MKNLVLSLIVSLFGWTGIALAENANVLFILDGSGSMKAKIDEQEKMGIAKVVISNLIQELPNNVKMGLVVYGHRSKGDCNDIELISSVGQSDKATLIQRIQSIDPKGKTPITQSLVMAGEQLKSAEEQTTVVLVSDGEETCAGDPCAAVRSLLQQGIKLKVHVVGFDVTDKEKQQLICIADAGGGKYFGARNAEQLKGALAEVKKEVVQKAEVKPQPVTPQPAIPEKKVIKIAGPGKIEIPNSKGQLVKVFEQQSGKEMGYISGHPNFLQVPPGTYKLQSGNLFTVENIAVEAGQEVVIEQ